MPDIDIDVPPGDLSPGFFGTIRTEGQSSGTRLPTGGIPISVADAIYIAVSAAGENHREPGRTIWCMIRRLVGMRSKGSASGTSLKRLVELFSQPINPAWAYINHWVSGSTSLPSPVINPGDMNQQIPGTPNRDAVRKAVNAYLLSRGQAARYPISDGLRATFTDSERWRDLTSERRQSVRQRNIRKAQLLAQGGTEARRQWQGILPEARRAIYTILRGGSGPPAGFINGFDDFASTPGRPRWLTDIWERSQSEQQSLLLDESYLSAQVGGRHRAIRFTQGGEYYIWRSFGREWNYGEVYILGPDGNSLGQTGELFNSSADSMRGLSQPSVPGVVASSSSGSVSDSSEEASWSTGNNANYASTASVENTTFDTWDVLEESYIRENMRNWAEATKIELGQVYRGRVGRA